jgi:hypothetical protein
MYNEENFYSDSRTLAQRMYDEYAPKGDKGLKKNIDEALEEIKAEMSSGSDHCELLTDWMDTPSDWVVFPETLNYLEKNGFTIEQKIDPRVAIVTWNNNK